jgi:ATP-dependent exoDNAse (exonuclease V) alpha subunit
MTQKEALEILKSGYNVFLTGSAGSGKTFLLNQYIKYLKDNKIKTGVTASTGLAATHLDGRTIHSWCGIGIEERLNAKELKRIVNDEKIWERIKYARVLIIDEISMLSASRLDLASYVCQSIRQDARPFGGLQIVLCGDFFQLPPVAGLGKDKRFVFDSNVWEELDLKICYLDEQYRHEDLRFFEVLNNIRANRKIKESTDILLERLNVPIESDINPTKLFTHNLDVDSYNNLEMTKLPGEATIFQMRTEGLPNLVNKLKEGCLAPERLELRIGAVVMFVRNNFDKGYVNGTIGKIISFTSADNYPIVETLKGETIIALPDSWRISDDEKPLATIWQIPLRLAWAITIHKSQGMSLDCAEMDLSRTFEYGMGYVALSRVRSLSGIKLLGLNKMALKIDKMMINYDLELIKKSQKDLANFKKIKPKERLQRQQAFLQTPSESSLFSEPPLV